MESRKGDNTKSYLFPIWKWYIMTWVIEFQSRYVTEVLMLARLRFQMGLDLQEIFYLCYISYKQTFLFYTGVLVSKKLRENIVWCKFDIKTSVSFCIAAKVDLLQVTHCRFLVPDNPRKILKENWHHFWLKNDGEKWSRKKYFKIQWWPSELLLPSAKKSAQKGWIGLAG